MMRPVEDGTAASGGVTKQMSLSQSEFRNSIAAFAARGSYEMSDDSIAGTADAEDGALFRVGAGTATISFRQLKGQTFGGLLKLPRAEVAISFHDVEDDARTKFLRAFEISFQRGGG